MCPFCQIERQPDQVVVLEDAFCLFLRQPEPILPGAGIIVPRAHRETVFDLTPAEWSSTYVLLRQARDLIDRDHAPDGYNVGWNAGAAAGQEVFHAHLHVLPRYEAEPLAGKGIRYWLKQLDNLRPG